MRIKEYIKQFIIFFVAVFVANAVVVYLWNLIFHGEGAFDWDMAFIFAITLGIVLAAATIKQRRDRG